jgi:hypothetical protein
VARAIPLGAGVFLAAAASLLAACGSSPHVSALQLASSHPDSIAAAQYVSIRPGDLPAGFSARAVTAKAANLDVSQTLAEYDCEKLRPPSQKAVATASTPDYTNSAGTTELHETTAVFPTDASAMARLQLERDSRYPSCKALAFRKSLVATAPAGARVGSVNVSLRDVPSRFGDSGVEVAGICQLDLPGGVSEVATVDLVVLVREHFVVELAVDTDGPDPGSLLDRLTTDLAGRLAQVLSEPKVRTTKETPQK